MKIAPLEDSAVLITVGNTADAATVAAGLGLVAALEAGPIAGLT